MGKHFSVGSPVIVAFDPHDICVVSDMQQFNGLSTIISKVHMSRSFLGRAFGPQYELKGVVSTIGKIPYIFTRDMLEEDEDDETD